MPKDECQSLERHESDIVWLRDQTTRAVNSSARNEENIKNLGELVARLIQKMDNFVDAWDKRKEENERARDTDNKEIDTRFKTIEKMIVGSSFFLKMANNIVTLIVTGIVLLALSKSIPELANFLR